MRVFVEFLARRVLLLLLFVFLLAGIAPDRHFAHSAGAKVISFDHQLRRNLSRAERADLRSIGLSCRVETGATSSQRFVAAIPRLQPSPVSSYATLIPL